MYVGPGVGGTTGEAEGLLVGTYVGVLFEGTDVGVYVGFEEMVGDCTGVGVGR